MSDTDNDADPRTTWRWLALLTRATPKWLLRWVARVAGRVIAWRYRDNWARNAARYLQFQLLIEGTNAGLYSDHVKAALDVLVGHMPVYVRWLHSRVDALLVNQLFMKTRTVTAPDYDNRVLMLHPYTVWKVSAEQLALHLVVEATQARLGRRFQRNRAGRIRAQRRALQEAVACARILPSREALLDRWERRLGTYNTQFPEAAA
jgi:hypothetical protein